MLRIDLAELIRIVGKNITVEIDDVPKSDEDVTYLGPAAGYVNITNTGGLVLVRGRVKTVIAMECGRCLTPVRQKITAEIEDQFSLREIESSRYNDSQAAIIGDEENELPIGLMDGSVMDLNVVIRQAVIISSPISPVCREDCAGLCPKCGKNRNENVDSCDCSSEVKNTPFEALKKLYKSDDDTVASPNE